MNSHSADDLALWHRLVETKKDATDALHEFLNCGATRIEIARRFLLATRIERLTALEVISACTIEEKKQALPELLQLSVSHALGENCHLIILSIPHDWLKANIEHFVEPILRGDNVHANDYRQMLELYCKIDKSLAIQLAIQACQHFDEDIREAGSDFYDFLTQN